MVVGGGGVRTYRWKAHAVSVDILTELLERVQMLAREACGQGRTRREGLSSLVVGKSVLADGGGDEVDKDIPSVVLSCQYTHGDVTDHGTAQAPWTSLLGMQKC
jgi:predicted Zn-dependent protease